MAYEGPRVGNASEGCRGGKCWVQFTRFASVDVKTDDSAAGVGQHTAPAVLFCSPSGADGGWVDISYLRNLSAGAGIEGDLTRSWGVRSAHLESH